MLVCFFSCFLQNERTTAFTRSNLSCQFRQEAPGSSRTLPAPMPLKNPPLVIRGNRGLIPQ